MRRESNKKIIRLLGVGFDTEDDHVRVTNAESYDVMMGSDESHAFLQQFMQRIEDEIKAQGKTLEEISPGELQKLVKTLKP